MSIKTISERMSSQYSQRSLRIRPIKMPLEPLKVSHRSNTNERIFLEAVERGDKHTVVRCLHEPNPVNVNCTNMLGRSAIQIAVDNENVEIVEILLQQDGVEIGDALLYAIREGVYKIVEMLIDHPSIKSNMLGSEWSKMKNNGQGEESSDYSSDISPVMLAAHCNQFEILQLLLLRGADINPPHQLSCSCKTCQEQVHKDSLRHSLFRINTFRALASPAWISLTSADPILTAFKLSHTLEKLALRENEFKDTYMELRDQCRRYSCDLLDQCRSSEEVIAVLNKECDPSDEDFSGFGAALERNPNEDKLTLSRLKLALKYEQKQFVAHPNCQQLLTSIWYEGLPGWRKRNGPTKFLLCIGLILIVPFTAVYYLIFPRSKIGQLLRSPFMKFLYHSASFVVFLLLLVLVTTDIGNTPTRDQQRGPPPSQLEWLIIFWVCGFVWAECKQLWEEGLKAYIRQWWNLMDFIMLSLYLATFSLRFVAYMQIESNQFGQRQIPRKDWPTMDPTLIAEGLFAIANAFSFSRIIYLFQANQHLGPLQISLGCMLIDIVKFLFIFFLVLTSFACGLNQLYYYYSGSRTPTTADSFYSLGESYVTLYWSLFGLVTLKDIKIPNGQSFTSMIGMILFMAYHFMAIIMLINMLIAMMSNSYQNIENHADMEWKFARSKLWMSYFDEGSTLPSPFNLIISPKSIFYFSMQIKSMFNFCFKKKRGNKPRIKRSSSSGTIKDVMRRLVNRYIHHTKKQKQEGSVNEDDLLEIKQDISSLRYELREDKMRDDGKPSNYLDCLRGDIREEFQKISPIPHPKFETTTQTNYQCYNDKIPKNGDSANLSSSGKYATLSNIPQTKNQQYNDRIPKIPVWGSPCSSSERLTSASDRDQLKIEMISLLREVLQEMQIDKGVNSFPVNGTELYQTHLYTQL
ncbi:transient receptor potential cation channel subfamily C member 4 [Mytilus galloprovincialis]|uniref:Transient receptor potential cation channel subfamily C member 4 n=1 Tax=Mytilus galloprovincialis TaxID=29158 RepID=A0A8B6EH10_MYTGA|nr:transient receptor potential cation channel subfamily C member 4 [Mytilus galloprovincialis]